MSLIIALAMVLTLAAPAYAVDAADLADPAAPAELTSAQVKALKPVAKAASYSYTKIKVSWNKISGATGYQVYRKWTDKSTWKLFKTVSGKYTSVTDKMLGNASKPFARRSMKNCGNMAKTFTPILPTAIQRCLPVLLNWIDGIQMIAAGM